jgi:lipoprotein-releasing system permease protein
VNLTEQATNEKIIEIEEYITKNYKSENISQSLETKIFVTNGRNVQVVKLIGIENKNLSRIESRIISGRDYLNEEDNFFVIGFPLALRLSARVGDTLTVNSLNNLASSVFNYSFPSSKKMMINGIFETNNKDYDNSLVFADLISVQNLIKKKQITSLNVVLENINDAEKLKSDLTNKFAAEIESVESWFDLHKKLYSVMQIERWGAFLLLSLIIAVASFNTLGSITMTVIEKKKDIAILKVMGLKDNSIKKVFMFEGMLIGIIGTLTGLIIGLIVCFAQIHFNFYPLDPRKYIIDSMPVKIQLFDLFMITVVSLLLAFFSSKYPANKALKTNTIDAIKWE